MASKTALDLKGSSASQAIQAASAAAAGNAGNAGDEVDYEEESSDDAISHVSLTEAEMLVRESLREKKIRAFRRVRGILKIMAVVRASTISPAKKKFQKAVRKVLMAMVFRRMYASKRHYPVLSNPKAQRAIYRLMMLIRMKLRDSGSQTWREKFDRAIVRLRWILKI